VVHRTDVRYVRVIGLPATKYGLSVFELEVYGGYTLRCDASPLRADPNSKAVATAFIAPRDQDDEIGVVSLDDEVVAVAGSPRVDGEGRIDVDLTTGDSGNTSLLVTHANGDEYLRCPVTFTVATAKLERLVKRANTLESLRYTSSSWAPLLPALEAAKSTIRSEDATQAQIDQNASTLVEAMSGLVRSKGRISTE
jgi:chondroitin AC lyase